MEMVAVGERFRAARKAIRISQKEMARALDVSANYISEVENGKANPGLDFFFKLESKYNISVGYLLLGKDEDSGIEENAEVDGDDDLVGEIDSVEKLVSLMEKSNFIKNTMLNFATQFVMENEKLVIKILGKIKKQ